LHSTRVGAAVFHWARRERVLLRDIFRLGTATSALLSVFYSVITIKLAERAPPGIQVLAVSVVRARLGEPDAAFDAETGTVVPAQRGKRQREYHCVTEGRLQVETIAVEETFLDIIVVHTRLRQVAIQLLDAGFRLGSQRIQAPRAFACQRGNRRAGDEHPLGDCLEPQVKGHFGARTHLDKPRSDPLGRSGRTGLVTIAARLPAE